ncbi:MAG TPA: O-antigen ligase family protein [Anaerolineaceae bacterium]|nr:O-antigen ligase family protein [Anaerolineaceae bacterium]
MISRIFQKTIWLLWAILVITLPLTTFPLVMKLTGSSSVAPASLLPLIPLVILFLPVFLWQKKTVPVHVKPVLLFFLFALLTVALAFLRPIPAYKDQSALAAGIEGAVTLILGLLFYLTAVSLPVSRDKIDKTLRLLNWTGMVVVIWSILQVMLEPLFPGTKHFLNQLQPYISPTRLLVDRMQGFASEPSWLAHMLNLVFLAYWLAASYNHTSAHRFRIWKFSFENLLTLLGIIVLVGTLSRGGLLAFILVLALIFLFLNIRLIRWLVRKVGSKKRIIAMASITLGLILLYLVLLTAGLWGWSRVDPRMETVFQFSPEGENPLIKYADNLRFGERVIYWQTGWNIFNEHPILGVGVGFSGFYFPEYLPDTGWGLSETRRLLFRSDGLLNIKNLWSRLLAETGIIGFALFITFLVLFGFTSLEMLMRGKGTRRTLGFMGVFMLVALVVEEFSVDSFALPYLWFSMGLVTAGWRWYTPANGDEYG